VQKKQKNALKLSLAVVLIGSMVAVALASALIHPYGPVKSAKPSRAMLSGAQISPQVLNVFKRSCQNCHSENTEWPWYSYVAPASMMIESDVARARSEMNLSRWSEYNVEDQQAILTSLAAAIRSGEMPPSRYTMIHPQSKLSEEERRLIYNWARSERQRLQLPIGPPITGD
jgi:uncharacterized membrane protein